ncbi:MAG: FAD-dependent oxidoreductase [Planctomycetota bacterium]
MTSERDTTVVLVEAEGFKDLGGWVLDQQFMDEMGSPFLLAHGLGRPVKDATTTVTLPAAGTYRVWVRTRDWVAPWNAPGAPGRFQVVIDGKPLGATFGSEGAAWHWQDGGTVEIGKKQVALALHDLTGFEGRCEAIALCADANFRPPDDLKELTVWRRKVLGLPKNPKDAGEFDLVVVGGGIAGTAAALSAARLGLTVALIQDRPVLGGNNSSEVRVWLGGETNKAPYPHIGDIVKELDQKRRAHYGPDNTADLYEDDRKADLVRSEKNASLFLGWRGNAVEMKDGRIAAVVAQNIETGERLRFRCRWATDCTGHAVIGALAGADFEMTRKGHMGPCNLWNVKDTGKPVPFPRCPWALDLSDKPFPGRKEQGGIEKLGGWYWESGFDRDPFAEGEYIRDWNFRAMYGAWDALKNVDKVYPNHALNWAAHISGPRESRRLLGDLVLTKEDLMESRAYPDGCVPTSWKIDVHVPEPRYEKGFEGDAFISKALFTDYKRPYWIPYRCLYSRNVPNLFMAGRNISVTHEALGTVRVMRTTGMMGEIVGMAASLCRQYSTDPRGVYEKHLDDLKVLMKKGEGRKK